MRVVFVLLVCTLLLITGVLCSSVSSTNVAYPTGYGDASGACMSSREVLKPSRDKNITAEGMKALNIPRGIRRVLFRTLKNTDRRLMHTRQIDLSFVGSTEDGAQWVVDNTDIKLVAQVVSNLGLPTGLERMIFKTDNTDRRLMNQIPFEKNYAGLMSDAAEWLVKNTTIKFIGVDYMSVASFNYALKVHEILLNKPNYLEGVVPGYYDVYCLRTKVETEAAPARCILVKPTKAKRTILDITHTLKNYMTVWKNYAQTEEIIREHNGPHFRTGDFTVGTDYGTHVDSPQHLLSLKDSPISALTLDLQTLIGRILVVKIPTGVRNITAQSRKQFGSASQNKKSDF